MKKTFKILLILFMCITASITKINAKSYINELFQSGEKIIIDNTLDGTAFIAGNEVEINETINGIGFIAGNELKVSAKQEYLFGIGTNISINNDIEKDLFLFSSKINIDSNVKRDAYIAGEIVNINGNIDRNIYIYGTEVNINGSYKGNIVIYANNIKIDETAKISGTLKYNKDANIEGINDTITRKTYEVSPEKISIKDYITNFISTYIHITLLAITLVFITEKTFIKSLEQTKNTNIKTLSTLCIKGFLILIGVPIIGMMLIFSGAFLSVGVVGSLLYGIMVYISNIFTAYFIAKTIDEKYFNKKINSYMLMIVGLFIIYVLRIIPIIGGLISFISILIGLGIVGNMIIDNNKQ